MFRAIFLMPRQELNSATFDLKKMTLRKVMTDL